MTKKLDEFTKNYRKSNRATLRSKRRITNIAKDMITRKRFSRLLRILGPGLVTGAAGDDPSGVATYSQAGASTGFGYLWTFPIMYPLLLASQESCSRIGAVTGKGLAAIIKEHYSKKLLVLSVVMVVLANTINIGADLGAMAATTRLFVDIPFSILVILFSFVILLLVVFVDYRKYAKILKWLALTLLAYPITAVIANLDWADVFRATFLTVPSVGPNNIYLIVGILGTTISPYCFFWETSQVVEEEISSHRLKSIKNGPVLTRKFLKSIKLDNFIGMSLEALIAWFVVVVCGSVLFSNGIHDINSAADAAKALEPLVAGFPHAGLVAKLIFSIGIIGIGFLAVPTLAGSSAYAISETFGWKEGLYRKFKKAIGFYMVIIVATLVGLFINFIGIDPIDALIFTAVFNGVAAVPLLWMIAKIGNNKLIMGEYKNSLLSNIFIRLTFLIFSISALALLFCVITGRLE